MSKSESSSFEDLATAAADLKPLRCEPPRIEDDDDEINDDDIDLPDWQDVLGSGHIMRRVLREGNGPKPQRGDLCTINYVVHLRDGKFIEKQYDVEVQVGDAEIIHGVDLVLPLMEVKEVAEIHVSPRFAFGSIGSPPDIPPDSEVLYTVEIVSIRLEPEMETLSLQERQTIGNKKRERGNYWYTMQDPMLAIQCYRKAISYLDDKDGGITDPTEDGPVDFGTDELRSVIDDRMKAYNNMAAAQIKMGAYGAALNSVDTVLNCQPNNVKALFRKGKVLSHKNEIGEALKFVRKALALSPDDKAIKGELARLEAREKKDSQKERDLARKMFGESFTPKPETEKEEKPKKGGKKWVFVWGVVFSVAIGAVSIALYKYKIM